MDTVDFSAWVEQVMPDGGIALCLLLEEGKEGFQLVIKSSVPIDADDMKKIFALAAEQMGDAILAESAEETVH